MKSKKNELPYLHFSTHRSGSVPIGILLEHYMENAAGIHGLGDVFEMRPAFQLPRDRRLKEWSRGASVASIQKRWKWLQAQDQDFFFTVYPVIPTEVMQSLLKNYQFVFSERRNLVAQVLSFLIVENEHRFYRKGGLRLRKESVVADYSLFRKIEGQLFQYFRIKAELKPKKVLTYEDFLKKTPAKFLKAAGFSQEIDWSGVELTDMQNPKDKLVLFKNPDDIESWYRESYLEKLCPWKKGLKD